MLPPSDAQYAALKAASELKGDRAPVAIKSKTGTLSFDVPRQGVTLVLLTPAG